ncbi:MAG: TIGR04255 family protein [Sphaerochaetaceae bacterium]
MAQLPKKLSKCPLVEATFEIRFVSSLPDDAVFGIVYQALKPIVKDARPITLPVCKIPVEVRNNDSNLQLQPHYQFNINDWMIAVGPQAFVFSNRLRYVGWEEYKEFILSALDLILKADIIKQIKRTGLRYINVINKPLFQGTRVKVRIADDFLDSEETIIHTTMKTSDEYYVGLQLNNNVQIKIGNQVPQCSSLIDIDVFQMQVLNSDVFQKRISDIMEESHRIEKIKFFNLLDAGFLDTLEPIY